MAMSLQQLYYSYTLLDLFAAFDTIVTILITLFFLSDVCWVWYHFYCSILDKILPA
jgi:hypothetical protein